MTATFVPTDKPGVVKVPSSRNPEVLYTVTGFGTPFAVCNCPGYVYQNKCWHVGVASEEGPMSDDNIHTAIGKVYAKVGYVQKTRTQGLNYSFAGERDLIEALRPALVDEGIYMHVAAVNDLRQEMFTTKNGTPMCRATLVATVRFTHSASHTWIDVVAGGEGMDSGDKALPKAMTGAYKYALRQTFCIETGDDPDTFSSQSQQREQAHGESPNSSRVNPVPDAPRPPLNQRLEGGAGAVDAEDEWFRLQPMLNEAGLATRDCARVLGGKWSRPAFVEWMRGHAGRNADVFIQAVQKELAASSA